MIDQEKERLFKTIIKPTEDVQTILLENNSTRLKDAVRATDLIKRPEITYEIIEKIMAECKIYQMK